VTALDAGSATISAASNDGSFSDSCALTVVAPGTISIFAD
jgi:uncharacterized protein YjdB